MEKIKNVQKTPLFFDKKWSSQRNTFEGIRGKVSKFGISWRFWKF